MESFPGLLSSGVINSTQKLVTFSFYSIPLNFKLTVKKSKIGMIHIEKKIEKISFVLIK